MADRPLPVGGGEGDSLPSPFLRERGRGCGESSSARGGTAPCCADRLRTGRHRCGPRGRTGPLLPFLRTPWRSTPSLFRHCRLGTGRKIVPGRSADQQRPGPHRCGRTCPASYRSLPGRPPRQLSGGRGYSQSGRTRCRANGSVVVKVLRPGLPAEPAGPECRGRGRIPHVLAASARSAPGPPLARLDPGHRARGLGPLGQGGRRVGREGGRAHVASRCRGLQCLGGRVCRDRTLRGSYPGCRAGPCAGLGLRLATACQ